MVPVKNFDTKGHGELSNGLIHSMWKLFMMTSDQRQFVDHCISAAARTLEREGEVPAHWIIGCKGGTGIVYGDFRTNLNKVVSARLTQMLCDQHDAQYVMFLAEGWALFGESALEATPSEHPQRTEILLLTLEMADGQCWSAYTPILVKEVGGKQVKYVEKDKLDWQAQTLSGRLVGIMKPTRARKIDYKNIRPDVSNFLNQTKGWEDL